MFLLTALLACGAPAETAPHAPDAPDAPAAPAAAAPLVVTVTSTLIEEGPTGESPKVELKIDVTGGAHFERTLHGAAHDGYGPGFEGSLWGVNTWWAGAGSNLRVVRDADAVVVKVQELDEEQTAEAPWLELARFPAPAGTEVTVATAPK